MRIVLDLQACQATNRDRGIGLATMSLTSELAKLAGLRGHDLKIILNNGFPDTVSEIRHTLRNFTSPDQFALFEVPSSIAGRRSEGIWRSRAAECIRAAAIAALKPDIVHMGSLFEGWVDDAVAMLGNEPGRGATSVTLHDIIPYRMPEHYLADPSFRDWYLRKLDALKKADLLLAVSAFSGQDAADALSIPAERIVNMSSAVDSVFRPQAVKDEMALRARYGLDRPFVMYTGGADVRKNVEGLIEAYAKLPTALRDSHQLCIVCKISEPERQRFLSLASRHGLPRTALVLTGYAPEPDLVDLYNLATLFVFPSLYEGFGLPVLEAMACGTPAIGSNSTSIPEVIGREDALFDPSDIDSIAGKMAQVLQDEGMRLSLKEHGLARSRLFSWKTCAERALDAFEAVHARCRGTANTGGQTRPKLAWVSPLPPDQSGIADYSAELVPQITEHYDVELVSMNGTDDAWLQDHCTLRTPEWFEQHADDYERVVYNFGNSAFHAHMFDLLGKVPGVVILHDFFLSGICNHIDHHRVAGHFVRELYKSHGYPALLEDQRHGRQASIWKYPINLDVLDNADGVIVHSKYSTQLARQWYGDALAQDWITIPHLRAVAQSDRTGARQRLGLAEDDYLVCAFGLLGPTKLNQELLDAWLASPMATDNRCRLVFVGENDGGEYGARLAQAIQGSRCRKHVEITGFAPRSLYLDYLAAADCAVQLRSKSRGETSGTILDCLAHGLPTIINAVGAAAEVPQDVVIKLPARFDLQQLIDAMAVLRTDGQHGRELGQRGIAYIKANHDPEAIGRRFHAAIESLSANGRGGVWRTVMRDLDAIDVPPPSDDADLMAVAQAVATQTLRPSCPRQLLVDISELHRRDAKTGIQRVVKGVLHALLHEPPEGFRIEPVYADESGLYRYARTFTQNLLGLPAVLADEPIEARKGDRYLGVDLLPHDIPRHASILAAMRNRGVEFHFVVHDLLPVLRPEFFAPGADKDFSVWLQTISRLATRLICVSRAVADELATWLAQHAEPRATPIPIHWYHHGADIPLGTSADRVNTKPVAAEEINRDKQALAAMRIRPSFLMVGTLEPRKGHEQALDALEQLWREGEDVNLVIIGKLGWMVETLAKRLRSHPESGHRLFWLERASDETLLKCYEAASALLFNSQGEGFGLPLIEAAQKGLRLVARDIPVFREVAGDHAYFLSGETGKDVAEELKRWLKLFAQGDAPASKGMPWQTWTQSAKQLLDALDADPPYRWGPRLQDGFSE